MCHSLTLRVPPQQTLSMPTITIEACTKEVFPSYKYPPRHCLLPKPLGRIFCSIGSEAANPLTALEKSFLSGSMKMVVEKAKKSKIEEDDSDSIDSELIQCIEKLQQVQEEIEQVSEEASEKILEIEQKYNEIRKPVYDRRNEIIKTIPDFWLTAFLSHPMLCDLLSEEDQKIFKYVDSLDVEDFKDLKLGYTITFNFKENPYFENTKLTKTLAFFDDEPTKITGTAIKWKEGMDASNGVNREMKGNKRPLAEESFFSWFSQTQKEVLEFTDEVAEMIKDDLWPNPLKYFNNDADEDSDGDEDVEEDNGDDDEDDNNGDS